MKKQKIIVKQDTEKEAVPTEILAQSIVDISNAMSKVLNGRLKQETLTALIKDKTGLTKYAINLVLNSLDSLKSDWLKK